MFNVNKVENEKITKTHLHCFKNGNVLLPFIFANESNMTLKAISEVLNITPEEAINQFNEALSKE